MSEVQPHKVVHIKGFIVATKLDIENLKDEIEEMLTIHLFRMIAIMIVFTVLCAAIVKLF